MSQAPTDGTSLLDPWGFWKTARDSNLEAWSKFMIDLVNSDEYAQATGLALEQALAASQPLRDAMERTMTQTLSLLNMPSRAEVISLAERLVNLEMRLDDMDAKLTAVQRSLQQTIKETIGDVDAKLTAVQRSLQQTIKETIGDVATTQNNHHKKVTTQLEELDTRYDSINKIEKQLGEMSTRLSALQAPPPPAPAAQPVTTAQLAMVARPTAAPKPATATVAKPEPKPAAATPPRAEAKAEPRPQPKPVAATVAKAAPKPATTTVAKTEPKPKPKPAGATPPRAEAKARPKPQPRAAAKPQSHATRPAAKKEQEAK